MTSDITLCINHNCPAADSCDRYASHHIASKRQLYFRPVYDPKRVPPCKYYSKWREKQ